MLQLDRSLLDVLKQKINICNFYMLWKVQSSSYSLKPFLEIFIWGWHVLEGISLVIATNDLCSKVHSKLVLFLPSCKDKH